jgi:hypothetical protein
LGRRARPVIPARGDTHDSTRKKHVQFKRYGYRGMSEKLLARNLTMLLFSRACGHACQTASSAAGELDQGRADHRSCMASGEPECRVSAGGAKMQRCRDADAPTTNLLTPGGQTRAGPSQEDPQLHGDLEPMAGLDTSDWRTPESMRSPGTGKTQGVVAALGRKRRLGPSLGCWGQMRSRCGPRKREAWRARTLEMKGLSMQ